MIFCCDWSLANIDPFLWLTACRDRIDCFSWSIFLCLIVCSVRSNVLVILFAVIGQLEWLMPFGIHWLSDWLVWWINNQSLWLTLHRSSSLRIFDVFSHLQFTPKGDRRFCFIVSQTILIFRNLYGSQLQAVCLMWLSVHERV